MAKPKPRSRSVRGPQPGGMDAFKPPTMRERMGSHADSAARSVMEQHPMMKKMRSDMQSALMSVAGGRKAARGPAARGRARSVFS